MDERTSVLSVSREIQVYGGHDTFAGLAILKFRTAANTMELPKLFAVTDSSTARTDAWRLSSPRYHGKRWYHERILSPPYEVIVSKGKPSHALLMRRPHRKIRVQQSSAFAKCRRKFLKVFPDGFRDETYLSWERNYKWEAHREWTQQLAPNTFRALLREKKFDEIAMRAVRIESGRSLLFSFEKMALRDAVRSGSGAEAFSKGLYAFLHGGSPVSERFASWCEVVDSLPRKQTRVLTWPLVTVFGFIAQPNIHIFLKPNTIKEAARKCGLAFDYVSRPNWETYAAYLNLAKAVRASIQDLRPRDMIDIQSFLWVQGSDEYR